MTIGCYASMTILRLVIEPKRHKKDQFETSLSRNIQLINDSSLVKKNLKRFKNEHLCDLNELNAQKVKEKTKEFSAE